MRHFIISFLMFIIYSGLAFPLNSVFVKANPANYIGRLEVQTNRGKFVDSCNRYAGVALGSAWCCSFQSFANKELKKHGNCYKFAQLNKGVNATTANIAKIRKGDLIVWNRPNRTGHIASIYARSLTNKHQVLTIEGNTSADDSSPDGRLNKGKQGVFVKVRYLNKPLMTGMPLKYIIHKELKKD